MASEGSNVRPSLDSVIRDIVDYVHDYVICDDASYAAAHLCFVDTLGCAFEGLGNPECRNLLGPLVPGTIVPNGARVPGTSFELDPVTAAFDFGCMARWLDFSDTFFAAQGSHPSDNIGGILAVADYLSRRNRALGKEPLPMRAVLAAIVKAYEIQGILSLENSFYNAGLDHVLLVKVATAAVVTHLMGGTTEGIANAVSNAWVDGASLSTYRRSPNAGTRKSWSGGDASARGVFLAMLAMRGEMGYPSALTAKTWGFYDVLFKGRPLKVPQPYGCSVVQDVQFKAAVPTVFNSQTAAECAFRLHPLVKDRLDEIAHIRIEAHETTIRLNSKRGPLSNVADRDHCVQYIVAMGLIKGQIVSSDYDDEAASDPQVDSLRKLMEVVEEPRYSRDYLDSRKRSSANAVQVRFKDGSATPRIEVEYPLGHRARRSESMPILLDKFRKNVERVFAQKRAKQIVQACMDRATFEQMPVTELMHLLSM